MTKKKKKRRNRIRELRKFKRAQNLVAADERDPFGPPLALCEVYCIHCGEKYWSDQIKWDPAEQLWVCRHWPECGGAGFGIDIHDVSQQEEAL